LPLWELVDVDSLVTGLERFLDPHLPVGQVLEREQPAVLPRAAHELARDIALV